MASKGFNRFGVIPLHQFVEAIRLWLQLPIVSKLQRNR